MKKERSTKNRKMTAETEQLRQNDVVDLILLDHQFMKDCIKTLNDSEADKREVLKTAKKFLPVLKLHSDAEKKTIYPKLESVRKFQSIILEGEIEHQIVDDKVKKLLPKVTRASTLNAELVAELKVTAELVKHHIREEESELLPKMRKELKDEVRFKLGSAFEKIRKFNDEQLSEYPELPKALLYWKSEMHDLSGRFMKKMDDYMGSMTRR